MHICIGGTVQVIKQLIFIWEEIKFQCLNTIYDLHFGFLFYRKITLTCIVLWCDMKALSSFGGMAY